MGVEGWVPRAIETSLESSVGEQTVDNSGLFLQGRFVSLVLNMRRTGLGKSLETLMEPSPTPGKTHEGPEGAVRLFLRTPERPTTEPAVEVRVQDPTPAVKVTRMPPTPGWIPAVLFGLDVVLVATAGLLLSVGTREIGKVLILGSILIGVAGVAGVLGVRLWRGE